MKYKCYSPLKDSSVFMHFHRIKVLIHGTQNEFSISKPLHQFHEEIITTIQEIITIMQSVKLQIARISVIIIIIIHHVIIKDITKDKTMFNYFNWDRDYIS